MWDTESRALVREFGLPWEGLSAALSPDGQVLAVGFGLLLSSGPTDRPSQYGRIFDLDSGCQLRRVVRASSAACWGRRSAQKVTASPRSATKES